MFIKIFKLAIPKGVVNTWMKRWRSCRDAYVKRFLKTWAGKVFLSPMAVNFSIFYLKVVEYNWDAEALEGGGLLDKKEKKS